MPDYVQVHILVATLNNVVLLSKIEIMLYVLNTLNR